MALRVWVVARTVFLDDLLAEAGQQGCRQVVLLGAGFDARAFRLPWPPGTRCFEVDTPDVLGPKDQVLAAERCRARLRAPRGALRPARRLARRAAGRRPGPGPADRVDRRGPARLPRPGGRGPAAGHDHQPLGPGQLAGADHDDPGGRLVRRHPAEDVAAVPGPRRPGRLAGRARGWAAEITGPREVLRAHGRPLPERTRPEPARAAPGTAWPGARGRGPAEGVADPGHPGPAPRAARSTHPTSRRANAPASRPARHRPAARPRQHQPRGPASRGGGPSGRRSSLRIFGSQPCCPRPSSRSRSSSTTSPSISSRTGRPGARRPFRPRAVAGVAGHVGELHAVPARRTGCRCARWPTWSR